MESHKSFASKSDAMLQHENAGPTAPPDPDDPTDYGLERMLDLPTELRCCMLELLIKDEHFEAYYTLLEHPEMGDLVRCNFAAQFKAIKQHRYLASQLQHILTTAALLSTHTNRPRSSEQLAGFLNSNLHDENLRISVDSSGHAVGMLAQYQALLIDADILTDQFVHIALGNAVARWASSDQSRYGTDTLSDVEHHRVLRAFFRLQLYVVIRKLYGIGKGFKRKIRSLFSMWTTWEFDEVRSLAEWIKIERPFLPRDYDASIRKLFACVDRHFYNDMVPYVRIRPAPCHDRNRSSKFAKKSKTWLDTPATHREGRADARNRDWRPLGYSYGCHVGYTQQVYREHCLAEGFPFWCRYTKPHGGWWRFRDAELFQKFGQAGVYDTPVGPWG